MSGYLKRSVWIAAAFLCSQIMWAEALFAEERASKSAAPDISNIGFMEHPPKELKDRFPMCDAFLKVEWIDKEKKIGYSHYEAIIKTKDGKFIDKKMVWALVDLDVPGIDYDLYQYKKQGRLEEIFNMVRNGTVGSFIAMTIKYKGKVVNLYPGKAVNYDGFGLPLLSDHLQTVCVAYPDEQLAWIVEGKNVRQSYSEKQIDELSQMISVSAGKSIHRERIESLWLLDINFDGINDFIFQTSFMYFESGYLYSWKKEFEFPNFIFSVPTGNRTCYLKHLGSHSLTTDGKSFYFENQCNLTALIQPLGKE